MSKKEDEKELADGFHITAARNYNTQFSLNHFRKISIKSTNTNSSLAHSETHFSINHGDVLLLFL